MAKSSEMQLTLATPTRSSPEDKTGLSLYITVAHPHQPAAIVMNPYIIPGLSAISSFSGHLYSPFLCTLRCCKTHILTPSTIFLFWGASSHTSGQPSYIKTAPSKHKKNSGKSSPRKQDAQNAPQSHVAAHSPTHLLRVPHREPSAHLEFYPVFSTGCALVSVAKNIP